MYVAKCYCKGQEKNFKKIYDIKYKKTKSNKLSMHMQ